MDILLTLLITINLAASGSEPVLGFANCSPALFRQLPAGQSTISISKLRYDSFGRVLAFVEDYQDSEMSSSVQSTIAVNHDPGGSCPKMKYTVHVAARQIASTTEADFKTTGLDGYFALGATDIGGIVVIGALEGDLQTKFSYDSFGRRQLDQQAFTYPGHHYEVNYSNVTFDDFGRLSGYRAIVKLASK
ncbi:MAG: hypothetical protein ABR555_05200 [Pyrinomonadaceae bacterium]